MIETLAIFILIISILGISVIIFQKIPLLLRIPEIPASSFSLKRSVDKLKDKLPFKNFSLELFLQKILSKIRILTLKTDNKTSTWLTKLRKRAIKKKKSVEDDNYWQEIKKSTKK